MRQLYESAVRPQEVDTLGHMNVRFYMERVLKANEALLASIGIDLAAHAAAGRKLVQTDTYCRYFREQFPGAHLAVRGGVLGVADGKLQVFHEVVNAAKNEFAATFIVTFALVDLATRAATPLMADGAAIPEHARVAVPEYGEPRSIHLGPPRRNVTYDELLDRLGDADADMMGGRAERVVDAADCDAFGYLIDGPDIMFSLRRLAELPPGKRFGPPTFTTDEGHRFGWAWLETRDVRLSQPRAGDKLRSISADIGIHSKTRHSRRWTFNDTTGKLASVNDTVGVALDLDARRSIQIPGPVRQNLEAAYAPELA